MFSLFGRKAGSGSKISQDDRDDQPGYEIQTVSLEGDPETIAAKLLEPNLPKVFLNEVDISTEKGQARLFSLLITRRGRASIEKDEIIRFVERNRKHLPEFLKIFPALAEAAKNVEGGEELADYFEYLGKQLTLATQARYEEIDVRSDRLFWLIYVLASQLASGKIGYDAVLGYLQKPGNRTRISSHQMMYMIFDYAESIGSPNQPSTEMVVVIGAAAQVASLIKPAHAAFGMTLKLGNFRNSEAALRYLEEAHSFLKGRVTFDIQEIETLDRIRQRYSKVSRQDF